MDDIIEESKEYAFKKYYNYVYRDEYVDAFVEGVKYILKTINDDEYDDLNNIDNKNNYYEKEDK